MFEGRSPFPAAFVGGTGEFQQSADMQQQQNALNQGRAATSIRRLAHA
jgi:hypothetical protein